jgi:metallophosphoesterase superfamily enzyme
MTNDQTNSNERMFVWQKRVGHSVIEHLNLFGHGHRREAVVGLVIGHLHPARH